MSRSDIPDHVHAAIVRHIDSVQQVEMLALMRSDPGRAWTAAEFCRVLQLTPPACDAWIAGVAAAGIVRTAAVLSATSRALPIREPSTS
jgi:hypothetical protein